jgi:hypothetical protein
MAEQATAGEGGGAGPPGGGAPKRPSFIESVIDNLPAWAFTALAIAALYLVWATITIMDKFAPHLPGVKP